MWVCRWRFEFYTDFIQESAARIIHASPMKVLHLAFCVWKATWMEKLIFGMLCAGADLMSIPISTKYQLQASRIDKYLGVSCIRLNLPIWLLYLCCCSMNGMNIQPQCTKTVNLNLRYCRHRTELTDSSLLRHDYYWTNERNKQRPCAFVLCSTDQPLTYIAVMVANLAVSQLSREVPSVIQSRCRAYDGAATS